MGREPPRSCHRCEAARRRPVVAGLWFLLYPEVFLLAAFGYRLLAYTSRLQASFYCATQHIKKQRLKEKSSWRHAGLSYGTHCSVRKTDHS